MSGLTIIIMKVQQIIISDLFKLEREKIPLYAFHITLRFSIFATLLSF